MLGTVRTNKKFRLFSFSIDLWKPHYYYCICWLNIQWHTWHKCHIFLIGIKYISHWGIQECWKDFICGSECLYSLLGCELVCQYSVWVCLHLSSVSAVSSTTSAWMTWRTGLTETPSFVFFWFFFYERITHFSPTIFSLFFYMDVSGFYTQTMEVPDTMQKHQYRHSKYLQGKPASLNWIQTGSVKLDMIDSWQKLKAQRLCTNHHIWLDSVMVMNLLLLSVSQAVELCSLLEEG